MTKTTTLEPLNTTLEQPETDVSTPQEPDLQQFTPEQINEHCESLKHTALVFSLDEPLVSVQIIRQLQEELAAKGMEEMGFKKQI